MSPLLGLVAVPLLIGMAADARVRRTMARWGGVPSAGGLAGYEVASRILAANGLLTEVRIMSAAGALSDHYDPRERTVHLSEPVFHERSLAAAAVAAHEAGHALQHASASRTLRLRSALAPLASVASSAWFLFLLLGVLLGASGLVTIAILLFAAVVVFHLVTLPVELDASRRGAAQLSALALLGEDEGAGARAVLRAAAFTYVAGALASALLLVYYVGAVRHG